MELRLIDDDGAEVPWDGRVHGRDPGARSVGRLALLRRSRGDDDKFDAGWLRTGDIAAIDEQAFVRITDRSKDVIKSGGEWISSVELENEVMAHPDVIEAAVIAMPDERWAERPLCCVVLCEGSTVDARGAARASERTRREMVDPRRVRLHGRAPQNERRQVRQDGTLRSMLADGTLQGRASVQP